MTMRVSSKLLTLLGATCLAAAAAPLAWSRLDRSPIGPAPDSTQRHLPTGDGTCPSGVGDAGSGPEMVRLPAGFCIDKTEVSRAQYAAWLETSPAIGKQKADCAKNADFTPTCNWPPGGEPDRPVTCVDWCDAKAYCEAAGKRLCGRIGGGAVPFAQYDDPAISEWHAACTSGGKYEYPYGAELNTKICRGGDAEDYTTWGLVDVGTLTGCHSPDTTYRDVLDLSGNAAEWENACDGDGPEAGCHIRGGSFEHNEHGLRCAMARDLHWPRTRTVAAVGFRCCAD